jgi:hypothetical protein
VQSKTEYETKGTNIADKCDLTAVASSSYSPFISAADAESLLFISEFFVYCSLS